ncbi:hypothetical protein KY290_001290 [Solanum tuberosum]|uniref:Uncharacterized protein n=1 Tax=Solanum tuberosum TaxID=4113 RepID=A0ABQ7WLR5_SOLTU|nr:hypothetical protein KY290_001290 [Solanum tuberosum]
MEAVRNKNYKEMDKNTQSKSQKEGDQKEGTNQQYNKQRDQEQKQHLEAILDKQNRPPIRQVTYTGQQQGKFNNKSGDRLSKKKREAIKKRLQQSMGTDTTGIDISQQTDAEQVIHTSRVMVPPDDYGALNSEDDLDPGNQSLEESDEDAEDTMKHTGQVVGSSF